MERMNKRVVVVAVDDSQESLYALSWAIEHLYTVPMAPEGSDHEAGCAWRRTNVVLYALSWAIEHLYTVPMAPEGSDHEAVNETITTTLVLLHAHPAVHNYIHSVGPAVCATPSLVESVKQAQEESSKEVLNKALHLCAEKRVRAETALVEGEAKEMICQAAEQMNADVLVVGSRRLGAIKRALLGSVSDYCAHHASCPVLIVKPPKESTN